MGSKNHTEVPSPIRIREKHVINPVDENKMWKLLEENPYSVLGLVLRLAWHQGLTKQEIQSLLWDDVDLVNKRITVSGREIPLEEDTERCLRVRRNLHPNASDHVVISDKYKRAYSATGIDWIVRPALNEEGLENVRLSDLRHDFVIRQIKEHDWTYAIRVAGLSVQTFHLIYANLGLHERVKNERFLSLDTKPRMRKVLQENQDIPEGIALWLLWEIDVDLSEIISLTWDEVDFIAKTIRLPNRTVPMSKSLLTVLYNELQRRSEDDDPHVLLYPRSRTPVMLEHLSKTIKTLLIQNQIGKISVAKLRSISKVWRQKEEILKLVAAQKGILRKDVLRQLDISRYDATCLLGELVEEGKLVRIYSTYYSAETTPPLEAHEGLVFQHLRENQIGYVDQLVTLLGLQKEQCIRNLNLMVNEGKLCKVDRGYTLPEKGSIYG